VKVDYRSPDGRVHTAYLDEGDYETDAVWTGVNKHTYEPISVRWDGTIWVQVKPV
jgi:hypothetical protein